MKSALKTTRSRLALMAAVTVMMFTTPFFSAIADNAEEEQEVKAPEVILAAFHQTYPAAKILNVLIETKDNVAYYEIESQDNSVRRDLLYFPDGSVFEVEEQIAVSALPVKVRSAIKANYPERVIKDAEKITRPGAIQKGRVEYGVILADGERELELLLTPEGVIKSQTIESDNAEATETSDTEEAGETDEGGEED